MSDKPLDCVGVGYTVGGDPTVGKHDFKLNPNHKENPMENNDKSANPSGKISSASTDNHSASPSAKPFTSFKQALLDELGIESGSGLSAAVCENTAEIIRNRSGTHGDAFENLADIARRWSNYLSKKFDAAVELDVSDVAYLMVEMKLSRATYGDNAEVDHMQDIMGYSAIGTAYMKAAKELEGKKIVLTSSRPEPAPGDRPDIK